MKKILLTIAMFFISSILVPKTLCNVPETLLGQRYFNFLSQKPTDNHHKNWKLLFSPAVKKIVNSKVICNNLAELTNQMIDIENTYGVAYITLLDLIESKNLNVNVIRFEITYHDASTETVITILKTNSEGLVEEINEVFGAKEFNS